MATQVVQPGSPWLRSASAPETGNERSDQRQEDDGGVHARITPFIMLMSSTAIEPRLRK